MIDYDKSSRSATTLNFYSDASRSKVLGYGATFKDEWIFGKWEPGYITKFGPSIEYLVLYAVVAGVLTWGERLKNIRLVLFCNNMSVVDMINNQTSKCHNCMYLLHLLTLNNLVHNRKIFINHVKSADNYLADSLSRLDFAHFWKLAPRYKKANPTLTSRLIWPASKIWQKW